MEQELNELLLQKKLMVLKKEFIERVKAKETKYQ